MNCPANLHLGVRRVLSFEAAIEKWLAARRNFIEQTTDENRNEYNGTLNDLGAAWRQRYPDNADTPGEFESFCCGLIAPDEA